MSNPIDTNGFTHFLNFKSLGQSKLYQIFEPNGFDVANFLVKQNEGRYARDITYGAESQNLKFFSDTIAELTENEQVTNPLGQTSFYLNSGYDWIMETINRFGFEGSIEYILKKDGLDFNIGIFDLANVNLDGKTFVECNIIQNNQISDYKKHESTKLNLYGTKNIKNENITAATPIRFLNKSVIIERLSEFKTANVFNEEFEANSDSGPVDKTHYYYYNNCNQIVLKDISDTTTYTNQKVQVNDVDIPAAANNFSILTAQFIYTSLKLSFSNVRWRQDVYVNDLGDGYTVNQFRVSWGYSAENPIGQTILFDIGLNENQIQDITIPAFDVDIPRLEIGMKVFVYFWSKVRESTTTTVSGLEYKIFARTFIFDYNIKIQAFENNIPNIISGVRYIDAMKQCSKNINNLPVIAKDYDVNGDFYEQIIYNRNGISNRITKPFHVDFKTIFDFTQEVNQDYEIFQDKIKVDSFENFYPNIEIGVFKEVPSKDAKLSFNERFKINGFKFGYKDFEQNRLSQNTYQDIHTESEWIIQNFKVENTKEINLELIRSTYTTKALIDLEIKTPLTADETDDKIIIVDVIPLSQEQAFYQLTIKLLMNYVNGFLEILNRDSQTDKENVSINWNVLGLEIGQNFEIVSGQNAGIYTVNSINYDGTVLKLQPVNNFNLATGDYFINFKYFYQNVLYQTRSREEFSIVSGASKNENYQNLKYSIRRNMKYWGSYLKTACFWIQDKLILNSYFKNNPDLTTQFIGENFSINEKENIDLSKLSDKILTTRIYELEVHATFTNVLDYLEKYKQTRGFIRVLAIDGKIFKEYVKDLDYTWKKESLKLILEEKDELEFLKIDFLNGILKVNDAQYEISGNGNWYKITRDYFQIYDINDTPISVPYRFDKVKYNGIIYSTLNQLLIALQN